MSKMHTEIVDVINDINGNIVIDEENYDTNFKDMGIDSLDTFNVLLEFEEKYEIEIPEEDIEKLYTINLFVTYISEKLKI